MPPTSSARLNRIVALKDLGFRLEQVRSILDEKVGTDELRGMLTLRQAELESQIDDDRAWLSQVEARLQIIESTGDRAGRDSRPSRLDGRRDGHHQALARWIEAHGFTSAGYNRELYITYGRGDSAGWVTELQEPIAS